MLVLAHAAPTRTILCAGAGSFEAAHITLTQGVHLGQGETVPEQLAEALPQVLDRTGAGAAKRPGAKPPGGGQGLAGQGAGLSTSRVGLWRRPGPAQSGVVKTGGIRHWLHLPIIGGPWPGMLSSGPAVLCTDTSQHEPYRSLLFAS
jgi:hypothetical protein